MKLTVESFIAGVRQSGLVDDDVFDAALKKLSQGNPLQCDAETLADLLITEKCLTRWQADKLLQGKFKGFVLGRYRLLDLLGRGEMSSVYLAEHIRMKRRCAIKVLPAVKVRDTSYLGRFYREAEAVASLDHPNIIRAYDVDEEAEAGTQIHFLAMEYFEAQDLESLVEQQGELSIEQAVDIVRQAAEGLAHAHENGLVHRDIKPGNLLVGQDGTVKLLDLGLARFFKSTDEESLTIKHDEKVLGTADYLAPEQAVDSHAVDERADIYSLGCTLYFALVGHPPFTDGTLVQRLLAHQTKTPPSVSRLRSDVPSSLQGILDKMMEKQKEKRFQTAREVARQLARWLVLEGSNEWRRSHPELVARLTKYDGSLKGLATKKTRSKRPQGSVTSKSVKGPKPAHAAQREIAVVTESDLTSQAPVLPARPAHVPQSEVPPPSKPLSLSLPLDTKWYRQPGVIIAALIVCAVLITVGIGYNLRASSQDQRAKQPAPVEPLEAIPTRRGG